MRYLLVIAHVDPNKEATAYRFANAAKEALLAAGHEVKVTDLVHEGFDRTATPEDFKVLKNGGKPFAYSANQGDESNFIEPIQKQHELIKWCQHIVVFAPMWMYRLPSCYYAWFERCFTFGFAFDYKNCMKNGFLAGRKASLVITFGGNIKHFDAKGYSPIEACLYSTTYGFRYCGIQPTRTFAYFCANYPNVIAEEPQYLVRFKKAIVKLDSWPLLKGVEGHPADGEPNDAEVIARYNPLSIEEILGE